MIDAEAPVGEPPSRAAAVLVGVGAAVVAAALAGLALVGTAALGAGVFAVQVVVALAWLAALDVRGGGGGFVIAVAAAAVADSVVAASSRPDIGRAAPVAGVALVVSLLYQLARKPRTAVTASLGGTLSAVAFGLCAATFVALRVEIGGDKAVVAALLSAGVALAVARLADLVARRPAALPGSRRGIVGVVAGLGAAVAVGWEYGSTIDALGGSAGLRLGLVSALLALVADLAVDAVLFAAPPADDRARSALPPLGILLPVVLAGPASYVAGRIAVVAAEHEVAKRIQQEQGLVESPDVSIGGFPFLTQAVAGRYDEVTLTLHDLRRGPVPVAKLTAKLTGVRVPLSDVIGQHLGRVPVDRANADVLLTYAALNRWLGNRHLTVGRGPGDEVKVTASADIAGHQVGASAEGRLTVTRDAVQITAGSGFDIEVPVPGLPFRIRLITARSTQDGIVIAASAEGLLLRTGTS